jgi:hypothetical protein
MPLHGAYGEFGDVAIGDGVLHLDLLAQTAETGAQDDARLRH